MKSYRLHRPLVAVACVDGGGVRLITLNVGTVLEVAEPIQQYGALDALWNGKEVSVLAQDFRARADLIEGAA
jgi:hypothetical protein